MVYEITDAEKVKRLFDGWEETIIRSALQGVMGKIYATNAQSPASAMIVLGDFCFLAGLADKELPGHRSVLHSGGFMIMVPQNKEWERAIEDTYGERAKPVIRYAMKKEKDVFDRRRLKELAAGISEEYELRRIDEEIYLKCLSDGWSADLVSQFRDYDEYKEKGLGVAVLTDGALAAGASSYSRCKDGIEIQIDTRHGHRRKGLATACGASLILECLEQGWYPSWDAQNLWSAALAEKLGYHFSHEYKAYEVWNDLID